MSVLLKNSKLMFEEVKAVKFFLWSFYLILFLYDLFYFYIYPYQMGQRIGFPEGGLGYWLHIALLLLLPLAIYLTKIGKAELIKYLFLCSYIILDVINNIMIFYGNRMEFTGGHVIEVYYILFSPIFINKRFFWFVSLSLFGKYLFIGLLLQTLKVSFPIILLTFICTIAWILLSRFLSYVQALNEVHDDLRKTEKLAVIGQMASAIGHEIKNPLSSLKGFLQLEKEKVLDDDQHFHIMLNEVDRINTIATDLLYLGKPKTNSKNEVDVGESILYAVSILNQQADESKVEFQYNLADDVPKIICDENQIKQVFINLIKNSIEAMPSGGIITIGLSHDSEYVKALIIDKGSGIPAESLARLGEPFYTSKVNGTGLGLMVTKKILEEHDAKFEIASEIGKGTTVELKFPL